MDKVYESISEIYADIRDEKVDKDKILNALDLILDYDNYIEIFENFVPRIINHVDGNDLLDYIYDIDEMNDYVMYLFHKNKVNISNIGPEILKHIFYNTYWGRDFVIRNINKFTAYVSTLIEFAQKDNSLYNIFADNIENSKMINQFITNSIKYSSWIFDEKYIVKALFKGTYDDEQTKLYDTDLDKQINNNHLGEELIKHEEYKDIVEKYGYELFQSEIDHKFALLNYLGSDYDSLKEKYRVALDMYNTSFCSDRTDETLSYSIPLNKYDEFVNHLKGLSSRQDYKLISTNTCTSDVYNLGNVVIKIGSPRYNNNINTNFFRIIPNHFIHLKDTDDKVIGVIEFQELIDTNPAHITPEMIYELFKDFKEHNMYISDPRCLLFGSDNFGILKSYKDASLGDYASHEDLPDNFKKNPLVLLDVDLVYEYGSKIKPPKCIPCIITMDDAIDSYETAKTYKK